MFSDDSARIWGLNPKAPYAYLGRPTVFEGTAHATVDFLFRAPDGRLFVAEQKSELAWTGYAYVRLVDAGQIDRHRSGAFEWFLEAAHEPAKRLVKMAGKPAAVDGAILVWGGVDPSRRDAAMQALGFHDALSLEAMLVPRRARVHRPVGARPRLCAANAITQFFDGAFDWGSYRPGDSTASFRPHWRRTWRAAGTPRSPGSSLRKDPLASEVGSAR